MIFHPLLLLTLLLSLNATAARLPGKLSEADISQVVSRIGGNSSTRLIRSAETYPAFPGIKLGVEIALVPSEELNRLGDQLGSLPAVTPIPRLYLSKGLPYDLEITVNLAPFNFGNGISTWGGSLKWSFLTEAESSLQASGFISFTRLSAFSDDYSGRNLELGGVISKDFVRLKPYAGFGLIFARGSVNPALSSMGLTDSDKNLFHLFAGAEVSLPVDLGFQIDLIDLSPSGAFFFGKKF